MYTNYFSLWLLVLSSGLEPHLSVRTLTNKLENAKATAFAWRKKKLCLRTVLLNQLCFLSHYSIVVSRSIYFR